MPEEPPIHEEPANGQGGMTPLHIAASAGDLAYVIAEIQTGADVNARDESGWAPLHWLVDMGMVGEGREAVLTALIQAGADVDLRNNAGETPLLRVCMSGNEDLARLLVEAGADLAARDRDGWSPLGLAVRDGYEEIVALLLEHGVSPDELSAGGESMLELARRREWQEVACVLESWGDARQQGTDWLALLANAAEDFDEARFLKRLDAVMMGSGVALGLRSSFPDPMNKALKVLPEAGAVRLDFVADYHRFLDRTSLLFEADRFHHELSIVFRTNFRYEGSAEDWAEIQAEWANRTRHRDRQWTRDHLCSDCPDVDMLQSMNRFVWILRRHGVNGGNDTKKGRRTFTE